MSKDRSGDSKIASQVRWCYMASRPICTICYSSSSSDHTCPRAPIYARLLTYCLTCRVKKKQTTNMFRSMPRTLVLSLNSQYLDRHQWMIFRSCYQNSRYWWTLQTRWVYALSPAVSVFYFFILSVCVTSRSLMTYVGEWLPSKDLRIWYVHCHTQTHVVYY